MKNDNLPNSSHSSYFKTHLSISIQTSRSLTGFLGMKIADECFEGFLSDIEEQLGEDRLPMAADEFKKILRKVAKKHKLIL